MNQTLPDSEAFYKIIHSLKVIATLKENDKLITKRGLFIDSHDNIWQSISRWIYTENRCQNIDTLVNIFNISFDTANAIINHREAICKIDSVVMLQNKQEIKRLIIEITNADKAITHLIVTYSTDSHTVAKIELLRESIHDRLSQIEHRLSQIEHRLNANSQAE
jgi:hypothetical protein